MAPRTAPTRLAALDGLLVELFCDGPAAVAVQRFMSRRRHPGHLDPDLSAAQVEDRVARLAATCPGPLRLGGPLLSEDTTAAVDLGDLADRITSLAGSDRA